MKIFGSTLFVLGLMDVCFGRSMIKTHIEKRFNEATYAFKFRVTSKATAECWPGPNPDTTQDTTQGTPTTTPTTTIASTADTTRATTTSSISTSTDRFTTTRTTTNGAPLLVTNTANETSTHRLPTVLIQTTKATTTPTTTMKSSDEIPTENAGKSTPTSSSRMQSSSQATTTSSIDHSKTNIQNEKLDFMSSTARPTNPSSPKLPENDLDDESKPTDNAGNLAPNTTESVAAGRMKRSCQIMVAHQDIRIRKIFKGCDGVAKMKRVDRLNKRYLKSTIRLQMDFSELRPGRNYLFMGRAVPGQQPSDYVFMADELTVVNWKPDAMKLKKYFKSKGRC